MCTSSPLRMMTLRGVVVSADSTPATSVSVGHRPTHACAPLQRRLRLVVQQVSNAVS